MKIKCDICDKMVAEKKMGCGFGKRVCCNGCFKKAQEGHDFKKIKFSKPRGQTGGAEKVSKHYL